MGSPKADSISSRRTSPHAEGTDTSMRAPQVCLHCKSIKKGCDKRLPSCSQCIKRRAICRYGEPSSPRRYGDEILNESPGVEAGASTWARTPRSVLARLHPTIRLSILLMNSISDILRTNVLEPTGHPHSISTDTIFHSKVCNIIRADGQYVEDYIFKYFNGVHGWLPIISKARFYDKFRSAHKTPMADFSILLLAIRLIVQHPSPDTEIDGDRETLYLATKALLTQVQTFIPSSLCLVQAGIIISHYEQAHGMTDAAYISIGTCARMAFAIGMHNATCSTAPHRSEAWFHDEEVLSTWWGLVICDNMIAADPRMAGRPRACRPIRDDDYLPMESDELASETSRPMSPTFRYYVSSALPSLGRFTGEIQATYLLGQVQLVINEGRVDADTLISLGRRLQSLLTITMNQPTGRWRHYSSATKTLIVAMYALHRAASSAADVGNRQDCMDTIKVTLDTITRMIIDIAHTFNAESHTFDIDIFHPSVADIVQCAQQHILMCQDFRNEQWLYDFEALRKMLQFYNTRWNLAGQELRLLDNAVENAMNAEREVSYMGLV